MANKDKLAVLAVYLLDGMCSPLGRMVDEIVWVKMTVNRRMAKSHGYYLQHAKVRWAVHLTNLFKGTRNPCSCMKIFVFSHLLACSL